MVLAQAGLLTALLVASLAFVLRDVPTGILGYGRTVESINNKNCQNFPEMQACEDLWMHGDTGLLYAACSTTKARKTWFPNPNKFDAENRSLDDYLAVVDTRGSGPISSRITRLSTGADFKSKTVAGKGELHTHGFGVHTLPADATSGGKPRLRLFVINHRPSLDLATGELADNSKTGANSTIELFETILGSSEMSHIRTYASPVIRTPNDVVPVGPDSFVFSNDFPVKIGIQKKLGSFLALSDVGYCDAKGCKKVIDKFLYPNGVAGGTESGPNPKRVAIASSGNLHVTFADVQADGSLVVGDKVKLNMPMDNMNYDSEGNLYVAAFPKAHILLNEHFPNPATAKCPVTIWKISPNQGKSKFYGEKYKVEKFFEDDGSATSGISGVAYDPKTKQLWLGTIKAPWTTVCQL